MCMIGKYYLVQLARPIFVFVFQPVCWPNIVLEKIHLVPWYKYKNLISVSVGWMLFSSWIWLYSQKLSSGFISCKSVVVNSKCHQHT